MDFTYYLPGPNNTRIEYNTSSNSVIIIGANGSGKSKLGAWIEKTMLKTPIVLERSDHQNLGRTSNR